MRSFRLLVPVGLCLALLVLTATARATAPPADPEPSKPGLSWRFVDPPREHLLPVPGRMSVSMDILVGGRALPTVEHAGKTYLPVRLGDEYNIRLTNHGARRVVAVVSVDGLSVITGNPASENDTGYIVPAHGSVVIKGWRKNDATVAAFRFEDREVSHAFRSGRPDNIGVIGLVAFEEEYPRRIPILERDGAAPPAGKAAVGETGTGYGRDVSSPVVTVPFIRSANKRTLMVYYDTAEALRRAGVPVEPRLPDPFPRDR